ncbi:MAG TPA: endonuclease/exonuclease/phosphatase family protein [Micromonosporaceae bacterium]
MADGTRLRVVTYNVHSLRDDRAALASVVRDLAPDVVIVQESPRRLRWRTRCATLAHAFGLVVAAGGQPAVGNLVLTSYRVRVHDTWVVRYPLVPGRHLRGAAFARCSVGRVPFVVVGSHLSLDPTERVSQAHSLRATLAGLDAPVVLGVDVNDVPDSVAWRRLCDGRRDAAVAGPAHAGGTATFPADGRRIDAIFVDSAIEVAGYRVVDSDLARRASDHLPVVADLVLPVG